jgi:hypothetical protein
VDGNSDVVVEAIMNDGPGRAGLPAKDGTGVPALPEAVDRAAWPAQLDALLEVFEGRRQLIVYNFMWHPGKLAADQCEGRHGGRVFETYWSSDRAAEAMAPAYGLLEMTVYGRQEMGGRRYFLFDVPFESGRATPERSWL